MKNVPKNKKIIIAAIAVFVLLIVGTTIIRRGKTETASETTIPTSEVIPTVDASVKVELKSSDREGVATLTVKNAPVGTKKIEYQVSYDAAPGAAFSEEAEGLDSIPQGFQGTCKKTGNTWECGNEEPIAPGRRVIVFGSSSSGVYRFHEILGKIKVTLEFSGSYGKKLFEKEYDI